jgi:2-haloalkanoic acid dehalogenase type II
VYDALLLDFYGTLVAEDDAQIAAITARVAAASPERPTAAQVSGRWSQLFARGCAAAHGAQFRTQREIELASLRQVLAELRAPLDPAELSAPLFAYWARPAPLPGASEFLCTVPRPVCIVSNIDDADLASALGALGWRFERMVTSEQCRAYKPRGEMFAAALARLGCTAERVLHVGDSVGSDLRGATAAGIAAAWVNPTGRALPGEVAALRHTVSRLTELASLV